MSFSKVVLVLLFVFGVFCVFSSPGDPDFGWHYKYGEYIVEHARVLRENTFSFTFSDYKWANSYWISQVVFYLSHHYLGHLVAGLFFSFILSISVIYYVKGVSRNLQSGLVLVSLSCLLLFVEFSGDGLTVRPMFFSSLFLMLLTSILLKNSGRMSLWLLPPLFLIWANTHADFVLGLFILGLFVVDRMFRQPAKVLSGERLAILVIGALSVLITLINPYGLELWRTLLKESHPFQFSYISEWVPVTTKNIYNFAAYCSVLGLFASALIGARHKFPLWYMLSLGIFSILSIRSQYFFRVAVILGIYALLVFWVPHLSDLRSVFSSRLVAKLRTGFLLFLTLSTLGIVGLFYLDVKECLDSKYWIEKQGYPQEAINYTLSAGISGNVFNYYGWGGYMIWKYPQIQTFVDGRMPSWRENNKSVFEDYIKIVNSPKKNAKILTDYNVDWIIYPTDSEFVKYLQTPNSGWTEVYSDGVASVFVETTRFVIMNP